MKKKYWIILFLLLGTLFLVPSLPANADSGWDSDYDSGSSWGGSDYDYDSGSSRNNNSYSKNKNNYSSNGNSGHVRSKNEKIILNLTLIIAWIFAGIIIILFPLIIFAPKENSEYDDNLLTDINPLNKTKVRKIIEELISKYLPDYTVDSLIEELYHDFVAIQMAWMNFDYKTLENMCSDELYQSYRSDLDVLKSKNGQNIMSNFELKKFSFDSIEKINNQIIVKVVMQVSFFDYVTDTKTGAIIRGQSDKRLTNTYSLTYAISENKLHSETCPSCGAVIKEKNCPYCNSKVKEYHHGFQLMEKHKK